MFFIWTLLLIYLGTLIFALSLSLGVAYVALLSVAVAYCTLTNRPRSDIHSVMHGSPVHQEFHPCLMTDRYVDGHDGR